MVSYLPSSLLTQLLLSPPQVLSQPFAIDPDAEEGDYDGKCEVEHESGEPTTFFFDNDSLFFSWVDVYSIIVILFELRARPEGLDHYLLVGVDESIVGFGGGLGVSDGHNSNQDVLLASEQPQYLINLD